MKFNPKEIAKQLSNLIKDDISYDEEENKFIGFMDCSEISSEGIYFFVDANEPCNHELNLSPEALEYILKVIQLLKDNKNNLTSIDKMKKLV